jgi:hypothetical protein
MVGRRWDTSITQPIDYSNPHWTQEVQTLALHENNRRDQWFIDYFVFSRGLYGGDIPPMGIGAIGWDNWLIWKALRSKSVVVDASSLVIAVHQNHDYSYHPQGKQGVWTGKEAMRNLDLAGGRKYLCNILHATRELTTEGGIRWTWLQKRRKSLYGFPSIIWHSLLELTYVPRHALGLSRQGIRQLRARIGARRTPP